MSVPAEPHTNTDGGLRARVQAVLPAIAENAPVVSLGRLAIHEHRQLELTTDPLADLSRSRDLL